MTNISEAAMAKAKELINNEEGGGFAYTEKALATFIQQVNDAAKEGQAKLLAQYKARGGVDPELQGFGGLLAPFILPEPVDPLLIEAREICARVMLAHRGKYFEEQAVVYRDGDHDDEPEIEAIRAILLARAGEA